MDEFFVVGIDPGLGGGLSIIHQKSKNDIQAYVYDIPLIREKPKSSKTKGKNDYDVTSLAKILKGYEGKNVFVCLEKVSAMPGQGVSSMFTFGEGFGIWRGLVGALGFNLTLVTPMTWKKEWGDLLLKQKKEKTDLLKLSKIEVNRLSPTDRKKHKEETKQYKQEMDKAKKLTKDHARELAAKLYPNLKDEFKLKKDDGKAESILIAEFYRRAICRIQEEKAKLLTE
jgi:crossover junction endodeoxyribonuclease RuvC